MGYNVIANCPYSKKTLASISFRTDSAMADSFFELMKAPKNTVRRVYSLQDLRMARKYSVNVVKDQDNRREIKSFLTACIDQAKGDLVDIYFQ